MRKILLADDDFLVRTYLSGSIDWEKNGFTLVGAAQDGEEALKMIQEQQPQILLTDIDMPVMNGIELIRKIKESGSKLQVIVLSCHDDFVYVKEAMRLGAEEYILKDNITPDKLLQVLQDLCGETEDSETGSAVMSSQEEQDQLLQLLNGACTGASVIRPDAVMAVRILNYDEQYAYLSAEQKEHFFRALVQNCREACSDQADTRAVHVRGGLAAVLCKFQKGLSLREQQSRLQESANTIRSYLDRYLAVSVQIGISEAGVFRDDVQAYWGNAQDALAHYFYEKGPVFYGWQCGRMGSILPKAAELFLEQAEEFLLQHDRRAMKEALEQVLDLFEREKTCGPLVGEWSRKADKILRIDVRPAPADFSQMRDYAKQYIAACEEKLPDTDRYSEPVAAAVRFIQSHYRENIALADAAEEANLTTTYFSFIFHKETGITFSEYLQSCRLNHAKELLAGSGLRIHEIGVQAGYHDMRHFSKVFKKETGMTPKEFRKRNQQP
ncbi:MAG: response regulator [Lachnospiraceae bacterium]|nr:response regulator [Lachnospiraceae bacterium]